MAMARTQTLVQLSDRLLRLLDTTAAKRGVSRSQVIRDAVEAYLHDEAEAEIDRRMVEGYARVPQRDPEVDEWGDLTAVREYAAAATMRRLDEEERAAGHDPWSR